MLLKFHKNLIKFGQITIVIIFATKAWGQEQAESYLENPNYSSGMAFVSGGQVYMNEKRSA